MEDEASVMADLRQLMPRAAVEPGLRLFQPFRRSATPAQPQPPFPREIAASEFGLATTND